MKISGTVKEVRVRVKDDSRSYVKKELVYEHMTVDEDDPTLKRLINECLKEFGGEPTDVKVTIGMTL